MALWEILQSLLKGSWLGFAQDGCGALIAIVFFCALCEKIVFSPRAEYKKIATQSWMPFLTHPLPLVPRKSLFRRWQERKMEKRWAKEWRRRKKDDQETNFPAD